MRNVTPTEERRVLEGRDPRRPFAWVICEHWTYIIVPEPRHGHGSAAWEALLACELGPSVPMGWYWWSGAELIDAGTPEALATLMRDATRTDSY